MKIIETFFVKCPRQNGPESYFVLCKVNRCINLQTDAEVYVLEEENNWTTYRIITEEQFQTYCKYMQNGK